MLAAAALAGAYLLVEPRSVDLAALTFRAELFGREGFTIWNGQWYGGHHTPAYSVLAPPLAWLLGPMLLGAVSAVAAAALFEPLARRHFGERARYGALWFGVGSATLLLTGRVPFALGVAIGLGSLLALQRQRPVLASALAGLCSLASPVAGLFLALGAVACMLGGRRSSRRPAAWLVGAALVPPLALSVAFPEGGHEPFAFSAFFPVPLFALATLIVLPARERPLRIGAVLYGAAAIGAFLVDTPLGGNIVRLGALFGGPLLASALLGRARESREGPPLARGAPLLLLLAAFGVWQWSPAVRDFVKAVEDPAAQASYYRPLQAFLERQPRGGRVEIPFTRSHWESVEIGRDFPLARGWQRQLDTGLAPIFYEGPLNDLTYANWLSEHGVRFVALPSAKPDYSAYKERALIERGPPYLALRWRSRDWRVYEVTLPGPVVVPERGADVRLRRMASDGLELQVRRPGEALVRVRWTPYWLAHGACVQRDGDWTRVIAERPGRLRLTTRFSPERVLFRGERCG